MSTTGDVATERPWPSWRYALAALLPTVMAVTCVTMPPLGDDDGKEESLAAHQRVTQLVRYDQIPDALVAYENTSMVCRELTGQRAAPCAKLEVRSDGTNSFFLDPFHRFHVEVGPNGDILSVTKPEYINPD